MEEDSEYEFERGVRIVLPLAEFCDRMCVGSSWLVVLRGHGWLLEWICGEASNDVSVVLGTPSGWEFVGDVFRGYFRCTLGLYPFVHSVVHK
jgi:hypothetical protein